MNYFDNLPIATSAYEGVPTRHSSRLKDILLAIPHWYAGAY